MIELVFFILTAALLLLPLLPAFGEWRTRVDVRPLIIVRTHDSNVSAFAAGFRTFIARHLGVQLGLDTAERDAEASPSQVAVGQTGLPFLDTAEYQQHRCTRGIVSTRPIRLPDNFMFSQEVYGGASVLSGRRNLLRAVLCERDLYLRSDTTVVRWVHANRVFVSGRCSLPGRVSADTAIHIKWGTTFCRLHAPHIFFGERTGDRRAFISVFEADSTTPTPHDKRVIANGDAPCGVATHADTQIAPNAHIRDNIKSHGNLIIGQNSALDGAVICSGDLTISPYCRIRGPVLAEGRIRIQQGCRIGSPESQTTMSAPMILVSPGVVVCGSVWASEGGATVSCETPQ